MDIDKHKTLLDELRVILGMINETQAKGRLLLDKSDDGYELTEEEVAKLEQDTVDALSKLAAWQIEAKKTKL